MKDDYESHLRFCNSSYSIVLCYSVFLHIQLFYVLYSYTFNRFMLLCIPTHSIVLCCSVFIRFKSLHVIYLYIFNRFMFCISIFNRIMLLGIHPYCSVFLHLKLFNFVLYFRSSIEILKIKYILKNICKKR